MTDRFWTAPNQLTLLRFIFVPFIIISVIDEQYAWALGLFVAAGISDGLDGLLARALNQRSTIGQYLDPIADKMLLSSLFLVLSLVKQIPWRYTILVFSRDLGILAVAAVLYSAANLRDFRPSVFGKMNTFAQITAVFFVLLSNISSERWLLIARRASLYATFAFTIVSGIHYIVLTGHRLKSVQQRSAGAR